MKIADKRIDNGKAFDWGLTSEGYAKYRDIYPADFYKRIIEKKLCIAGQKVLDLGTGTGVLPINMYKYGADWVGVDITENQINEAKRLASEHNMNITFVTSAVEDIDFPDNTFDVITACQCFWYFNHKIVAPKLAQVLGENGRLLIMQMMWLPFEDKIAAASEQLVLKYSPGWSGAGEVRRPVNIPQCMYDYFDLVSHSEDDVMVPFTKESWHGRMRACRGVGASLSPVELAKWNVEHKKLLDEIATDSFEVLHYAAIAELKVKK